MRSAAAIACCRSAFTRLNFLAGPYIMNRAAMNAVNSPSSTVRRNLLLPYHSAATNATPPMNSISGGSIESTPVTFMFVR